METNNLDERNTHEVYDQEGNLVAEGTLDYIGAKMSVFSVYGLFDRERIAGTVRIVSKVSYEEVYSARVVQIEANRIIVDGLRNISADLREDLKVDYRGRIVLEYEEIIDGVKTIQTAEGRMENISGGGVGFVSEKQFQVGQVINLKTVIPDLFFEIQLEVLRKELFGRLYKYGCKFYKISRIEESAVRKVVYKLQIDGRNYDRAREASLK